MNKIQIDKDWLYQKYIVEKLPCTEISKLINVSENTIRNRLKEYGIQIRPSKTPIDTVRKIIEDYLNGCGTVEISKKYNLNRGVVQQILKRNNIELRRVSPWKKKYNIHFFDTYTKESCYWAGFIAADGNVKKDRNSVSIHLQLSDLSHLEKFARAINFEGSIEKTDSSCRITIDGEWYVKKLKENFDIVPQKTFIIAFPTKMPKEFMSDYLRGYFDGDGNVSDIQGYARIQITSGSQVFLNQCIDYFYNFGIRTRKNKNNDTEKPKIYNDINISYTCNNAIKILDFLYQNSTEDTRLTRKYNKYLTFKENKYGL